MDFHIGCPVWSFKGWVGNFYPEGTKPKEFLREYARRLTTVEGNTTFYAVPSRETVEGWAAEMPDGFRFCPKIPKAISHEGTLVDNIPRAEDFIEIMRGLGARLGPMFLQLPPRFPPHLINELQTFLSVWPQEVRLAVEVRNLDWFDPPHTDELNALLSDFNMARVTIDTRPIRDLAGDEILEGTTYGSLIGARERKPDVPVIPHRTADFVFIRYIGHPDLHFNDLFLDEWGNYLAKELQEGADDAYVFCHSPENLTAPLIARELYRRVAEQVGIPELPWNEADNKDQYEQGRLF
jgi:uncharacterized protein YecE (DUF72 family)